MPLSSGDRAPDWRSLAVVDDTIAEVTSQSLLRDRAGLVLTTYPLDFSSG